MGGGTEQNMMLKINVAFHITGKLAEETLVLHSIQGKRLH